MLTDRDHLEPNLHLVAWEITRRCNLLCAHCRAAAEDEAYEGELSTDECFRIIDSILEVGKPIMILTGGEPLLRPDIFKIGKYATNRGLRVVIGTNGTVITEENVALMQEVPISRVGVSIDFPTPELQDKFRGKPGAFSAAIAGIREARRAGIEVQINSTITKMNASYLDDLLKLALDLGAIAFHPFMLVPTGRGKGLADVELPPEEYERILNWIYDKQSDLGNRIFFKPTDAPHYMRIALQRQKQGARLGNEVQSSKGHPMNAMTRGCLAGVGFCFISHVGRVQGCGYFDVEAGDLKRDTFATVWNESPLFRQIRDLSQIKGKCGVCEYKRPCGGCRARAYEATGDYLEAEPYCVYQPVARRKLDETDRELLNALQSDFPLTREPFADLAKGLGLEEENIIERIQRLKDNHTIRSIGPIFNSQSLGYQSTLVAMRIPEERLESAAAIVSEHPGVSHNYARDDAFNLWFTLSLPPEADLNAALKDLSERVDPQELLNLPAIRLFKIGVFFDMTGNGQQSKSTAPDSAARCDVPLEDIERSVISQLQQDLPLVSKPFDAMSHSIGMDIDDFLSKCRSLKDRGIMRRFGAVIRHQQAGFAANAMVCWSVPPELVLETGSRMADFDEVSHCYERRINGSWPYNLFTMIHGKTKDDCHAIAERIADATGIRDYKPLFSVREFKKERVKYQV